MKVSTLSVEEIVELIDMLDRMRQLIGMLPDEWYATPEENGDTLQ